MNMEYEYVTRLVVLVCFVRTSRRNTDSISSDGHYIFSVSRREDQVIIFFWAIVRCQIVCGDNATTWDAARASLRTACNNAFSVFTQVVSVRAHVRF